MSESKLRLEIRMITSYIYLCKKYGVLGVTLQKTASHAKVPFATAHYHWGGKKKELIVEALAFIGKRAQEYIESYLEDAAIREENLVRSYAEGTFAWVRERRDEAQLWLYFYYYLASGNVQADRGMQFVSAARVRVERLILESVGRGFYKRPKQISISASLIHSLVFSNGIFAIMSRFG